MGYYDRWNDLNRRARNKGERDADRGWMTSRHYDRFSECGAAYENGYYEKQRENERREEERQHEERIEKEREAQRRFEHQQRLDEQEYYKQQPYEEQHQEYLEQEYDEYINHMIRQEIRTEKSL